MRYIFYHYNYNDSLILDYDGEDFRTTQVYVYYTLRQAIKLFRKDYKLEHRHIVVQKLF